MSVFGNLRVGSSTNSNPFSIASTTGSNLFSITNNGRAIFGASSTASNIFLNGGSATTNVADSNSIAIGNGALTYTSVSATDLNNIALGHQALYGSSTALMTGTNNFAAGYQAGGSNTTGSGNSFIGYWAGYLNTTGSFNSFDGFGAGLANTTGSSNIFTGYNTGLNNISGSDNTALGATALYTNVTGNNNIALGNSTLFNSTGNNNIALGAYAGYGNTSGNNNLFLGAFANASAGTYSTSTAIGAGSIVGRSNALILGGTGNNYVNVGIGTTTPASTLTIRGTAGNNLLNIASSTGASLLTLFQDGNLSLGTTSSNGLINMERLSFTGNGTVAGINQYLTFANSTASAVQYANQTYLSNSSTATTTLVGNIIRLADSTTFGNTVRGFEVQTERGNNTLGENTAISGFARTFGVRGVTEGDAGGTFEPAGVYGESRGSTQGNAIRGYSSTITTSSLLKLFQDTSTFTGTGLLMNFGNAGGSFSSTTASRFIDLKNAGTSIYTVGAYGMLTIGNGTTNNAGLQIGYGGICVDNDGSCTASTTGRITSVSSATGNSDLAEMYFSNEDLVPGEIVYLKSGLSVGRANASSSDKVLGVVSTLPGLLMGQDDVSLNSGEEGHPIALKGRVPVRLSNENGDIKAGDELMLSSIPGVAMKASSTGIVVGRALEDFNPGRAYSETYINQFGESIIVPEYTPIDRVNDARLDDGCYYGGGNASGRRTLCSTHFDYHRS
ncbi:MAG: hypothetical protein R3B53_01915 [Candidatus Paceibacterota bacterium]